MAITGETVGLQNGTPAQRATTKECKDCNTTMSLRVCRSAAGHYIGYECSCGPYSRESMDYYPTNDAAREELEAGTYRPRGF